MVFMAIAGMVGGGASLGLFFSAPSYCSLYARADPFSKWTEVPGSKDKIANGLNGPNALEQQASCAARCNVWQPLPLPNPAPPHWHPRCVIEKFPGTSAWANPQTVTAQSEMPSTTDNAYQSSISACAGTALVAQTATDRYVCMQRFVATATLSPADATANFMRNVITDAGDVLSTVTDVVKYVLIAVGILIVIVAVAYAIRWIRARNVAVHSNP